MTLEEIKEWRDRQYNPETIQADVGCIDWLIAEVNRLNKAFEPMETKARKALEMNAMPILLNDGSKGAKRLSQLIVEWHEAEVRTATRCADLVEKSKSLAWGSNMNDLLQDVAEAIRREFKV